MIAFKKPVLELNHTFDSHRKRHYLNGSMAVLHCHHFTTLYSQLALDAGQTDLLREVAEDSFYPILCGYFEEHGIGTLDERVAIATEYYAAVGMGVLRVTSMGDDAGEVALQVSHVDQGWIKKWGTYDKPVNYITAGYIAALFSACLDLPPRAFTVVETESIVTGAKESVFKVVRN